MEKLPDSDRLAGMLLAAAEIAADLQDDYWRAWQEGRNARVNRDLRRDEVVAAAYANGGIDGKNAEARSAQLDAIVNGNQRLQGYEASLRMAEGEVKRAEGLMEAARTYRSALHDLVDLRVAELGVEAAARERRAIGKTQSWRILRS